MEQATYGPYAAIYDRRWGGRLVPALTPLLDDLLLRHLPAGANLLDLCCGTGRIAGALSARGYEVTGLDICEEMLAFARVHAPGCRLLRGDARSFDLAAEFDAVLSTSDSLNEIVGPEALAQVFGCVHRALRAGGRFVLGVFPAEGHTPTPEGSFHQIEDDHVLVGRESFDTDRRASRADLTLFYREDGAWQRWDSTSHFQFYTEPELAAALAAAGFTAIAFHRRSYDLGGSEPARRTYATAVKAGASGAGT